MSSQQGFMPSTLNRKVVLSSRPVGIPQAGHVEIVAEETPDPGPGEFLVRNRYLSVDPAMRGWVNAAQNYSDPVGIGEVTKIYFRQSILNPHISNLSEFFRQFLMSL